ncbi:MAG: hypothetical protein ACFFD4_17560 [Candidatus Odinarchaeota archaeon]
MEFSLEIDPAENTKHLVNFMSQMVKEREMEGILLVFNGFIDSAVIARLATEAVGLKNVTLLVRAEQQRREKMHQEVIETALAYLKLPKANIIHLDMNEIISCLFEEDKSMRILPYLSLNYNLGYYLAKSLMKQEELEKSLSEGITKKPSSEREKYFLEIIAHKKFRIRLLSAYAFLYAESQNYLVAGPVNKTEWSLGLFTKFGPWHLGDIMPLRDLYRSEILQIAEYLGIPEKIRTFDEYDPYSGLHDRYKDLFRLSVADVDKILVRLEGGLSPADISNEIGLNIELVEKVNHFYRVSEYQRRAPHSVKSRRA